MRPQVKSSTTRQVLVTDGARNNNNHNNNRTPSPNKNQQKSSPPVKNTKNSPSPPSPQKSDDDDEEYEYEEVEVDEEESENNNNNNHHQASTPNQKENGMTKNSPKKNNNPPPKLLSEAAQIHKSGKANHFDESDSDLWSDIDVENFRNPNHRYPPRLRPISTTKDLFKIVVDVRSLCGILCEGFFALVTFVSGFCCLGLGILAMVLWRTYLGGSSTSYSDGSLWAWLFLSVCWIVGLGLIFFSLTLKETILVFDKETKRIYGRTKKLLFSFLCCKRGESDEDEKKYLFGASNGSDVFLDMSVDDGVLRMSIEGYDDKFWHRAVTDKLDGNDYNRSVELVLRFFPDRNAASEEFALGFDGTYDSQDNNSRTKSMSDGSINNRIVLATIPFRKSNLHLNLWKNYFIREFKMDPDRVKYWEKNWIHTIGHTDFEKVDLTVERYQRNKKMLEFENKNLTSNNVANSNNNNKSKNIQQHKNNSESPTRIKYGKKITVVDNNKKKNSVGRGAVANATGNNQQEEEDEEYEEEVEEEVEEDVEDSDPKQPQQLQQESGDEDTARTVGTNDSRIVQKIQQKADKSKVAQNQNTPQQNKVKLDLLLTKANNTAEASQATNNSSGRHLQQRTVVPSRTTSNNSNNNNNNNNNTRIISQPSNAQVKRGAQASSTVKDFLRKETANADFKHLLTPQTLTAFEKLVLRCGRYGGNSYDDTEFAFLEQIREYSGRISFLRAPIVLYGFVIFPPVLLLLICIVATALVQSGVVENDYQTMTILIVFFGMFGFVALFVGFNVWFYRYAARNTTVRVRLDFKRRMLIYERGMGCGGDNNNNNNVDNSIVYEEIPFKNIVNVSCGDQKVLCGVFSTGQRSFVNLVVRENLASSANKIGGKNNRKPSVIVEDRNTLLVLPVCTLALPDEIARPYILGWEEFINFAIQSVNPEFLKEAAMLEKQRSWNMLNGSKKHNGRAGGILGKRRKKRNFTTMNNLPPSLSSSTPPQNQHNSNGDQLVVDSTFSFTSPNRRPALNSYSGEAYAAAVPSPYGRTGSASGARDRNNNNNNNYINSNVEHNQHRESPTVITIDERQDHSRNNAVQYQPMNLPHHQYTNADRGFTEDGEALPVGTTSGRNRSVPRTASQATATTTTTPSSASSAFSGPRKIFLNPYSARRIRGAVEKTRNLQAIEEIEMERMRAAQDAERLRQQYGLRPASSSHNYYKNRNSARFDGGDRRGQAAEAGGVHVDYEDEGANASSYYVDRPPHDFSYLQEQQRRYYQETQKNHNNNSSNNRYYLNHELSQEENDQHHDSRQQQSQQNHQNRGRY